MKLVVDHAERTAQDEPYGPMVCVCPEPKAHPKVEHGMCQTCKRKPLALVSVGSQSPAGDRGNNESDAA